uniref:Putative glutamine amidotransferase n=1 Tax=viral metagenome TaxID=1070528 RepID=A0A6M3LYR8_9ZZZZ
MCLIVAKPRGVKMPGKKNLNSWFASHDDGFGLAYLQDDRVHIVKGAMDIKTMRRLIKRVNRNLNGTSLDDLDVIFHFRQATDGTISPKNCHPFPITNDLTAQSALETETDIALAHNGIIFDYSTYYKRAWTHPNSDKTDTQEFIEDYLVGLGQSIWNPSVQALIEAYTDSKFALLASNGITYIGKFIEDNGFFFSNGGYKTPKPAPITRVSPVTSITSYNYRGMPYEGDWEDEGYSYKSQSNCEFCDQPTTLLYCPPKSDSLVCHNCFFVLEGRQPEMEDLAV